MEFTTTLQGKHGSVWGNHLPVPTESAQPFLGGKDRRVVATINGNTEYQCALMPDGNDNWFLNINKDLCKKLDLKVGTEVQVQLRKDESKYGLPMPEELKELLQQDPEGDKVFHSLTPGKQRNLLYIVGKPKSSDIRLRKALVIVDYLKTTGGRIDFKELNEALKAGNR